MLLVVNDPNTQPAECEAHPRLEEVETADLVGHGMEAVMFRIRDILKGQATWADIHERPQYVFSASMHLHKTELPGHVAQLSAELMFSSAVQHSTPSLDDLEVRM